MNEPLGMERNGIEIKSRLPLFHSIVFTYFYYGSRLGYAVSTTVKVYKLVVLLSGLLWSSGPLTVFQKTLQIIARATEALRSQPPPVLTVLQLSCVGLKYF